VVSDESELREIIHRVIEANPGSVEDYRKGKTKAIGFLVGQVMKETGGKADPKLANKLLSDELAR
jgi:aspartyl-tRNA(Asn)/glutamyl-tRNA(Gln) amidotransferase subunit B